MRRFRRVNHYLQRGSERVSKRPKHSSLSKYVARKHKAFILANMEPTKKSVGVSPVAHWFQLGRKRHNPSREQGINAVKMNYLIYGRVLAVRPRDESQCLYDVKRIRQGLRVSMFCSES